MNEGEGLTSSIKPFFTTGFAFCSQLLTMNDDQATGKEMTFFILNSEIKVRILTFFS